MSIIIVTPVLRGFVVVRPPGAGMNEKGRSVMVGLPIKSNLYTTTSRQWPAFAHVGIAEIETAP
jgi:hypothetical protein